MWKEPAFIDLRLGLEVTLHISEPLIAPPAVRAGTFIHYPVRLHVH